jgi:hypothetical protein
MNPGTYRGLAVIGSIAVLVAFMMILSSLGLPLALVYFFVGGIIWTLILRRSFKCGNCNGQYYDNRTLPITDAEKCNSCGIESSVVMSSAAPTLFAVGFCISLIPIAVVMLWAILKD